MLKDKPNNSLLQNRNLQAITYSLPEKISTGTQTTVAKKPESPSTTASVSTQTIVIEKSQSYSAQRSDYNIFNSSGF